MADYAIGAAELQKCCHPLSLRFLAFVFSNSIFLGAFHVTIQSNLLFTYFCANKSALSVHKGLNSADSSSLFDLCRCQQGRYTRDCETIRTIPWPMRLALHIFHQGTHRIAHPIKQNPQVNPFVLPVPARQRMIPKQSTIACLNSPRPPRSRNRTSMSLTLLLWCWTRWLEPEFSLPQEWFWL